MAKDQNLALNPGKLSGMCGRLKCCLAFEHPLYAELKRSLPKVGCTVATCRGPGLVRTQNILELTLLIGLETGGQITLSASEITILPRPGPPARRQRGGQAAPVAAGGDSAPGGPRRAERADGSDPTGPDAAAGGPAEPGVEAQEPPQEADEVSADVAALEDP
jgi:hypothetical protein